MRSISKMNKIEAESTKEGLKSLVSYSGLSTLYKNGEMLDAQYLLNRRHLIRHKQSMFEDTFLNILRLCQIHSTNPKLAEELKTMYKLIYCNRRFKLLETTAEAESNTCYIKFSPQYKSPDKYLTYNCNPMKLACFGIFRTRYQRAVHDKYTGAAVDMIKQCKTKREIEDLNMSIPLTDPELVRAVTFDMQLNGCIHINLDYDFTDVIQYDTIGFIDDDKYRNIKDNDLGIKGEILRCMILDIFNNGFEIDPIDGVIPKDTIEMNGVLFQLSDYSIYKYFVNSEYLDELMNKIEDDQYYILSVSKDLDFRVYSLEKYKPIPVGD